jgi:hypothetical protein
MVFRARDTRWNRAVYDGPSRRLPRRRHGDFSVLIRQLPIRLLAREASAIEQPAGRQWETGLTLNHSDRGALY